MKSPLPLPPCTQGYALVTPGGSIMGHTYRETAEAAIATVFDLANPFERSIYEGGYTVQLVYARIFAPVFFPSKPAPEGDEP